MDLIPEPKHLSPYLVNTVMINVVVIVLRCSCVHIFNCMVVIQSETAQVRFSTTGTLGRGNSDGDQPRIVLDGG